MSSVVYFASARATRWDYKYSLIGKLEEAQLKVRMESPVSAGPDQVKQRVRGVILTGKPG